MPTILRTWRGWTTPEDAAEYERRLTGEIFPAIVEETGEGYLGHEVARREADGEVEFLTVIRFDSWEAVESFAGEDYRAAHVPDRAREVLARFDDHADHYELRASEGIGE